MIMSTISNQINQLENTLYTVESIAYNTEQELDFYKTLTKHVIVQLVGDMKLIKKLIKDIHQKMTKE